MSILKKRKHKINTREGAASLFIVVFSILLLTIISLSFIKIALRGAKTASESDLSRSAYESAISGVEDAKRAVVKYTENCVTSNNLGEEKCAELRSGYEGGNCDIVTETLGSTVSNEQKLVAGGTGHDSDQAYTCVKVTYNTDDYLGRLETDDSSSIIPIRATDGDIDSIELNWFSLSDLTTQEATINLPNDATKLLTDEEWQKNNLPPVMVVQYFRVSDHLTDYDISGNGSFKTIYMYPVKTGLNNVDFRLDVRGWDESQNVPMFGIRCDGDITNQPYACRVKIALPETVPANSEAHFIRISKRYSSKANYQVKMIKNNSVVKFAGVQPAVDSNGRANDFFRRVESRLNLSDLASSSTIPYGAIEIAKGSFCKLLSIDDQEKASECEKLN